jgi:hypothetical protein
VKISLAQAIGLGEALRKSASGLKENAVALVM